MQGTGPLLLCCIFKRSHKICDIQGMGDAEQPLMDGALHCEAEVLPGPASLDTHTGNQGLFCFLLRITNCANRLPSDLWIF